MEKKIDVNYRAFGFLFDRAWAKNALLAQTYSQSQMAKNASVFSHVDTSFVSTRIGGNICINPLPQFTRSADIRRKKISNYGNGMGRYYYEAYQENYQIIHIRCGVASFNSLILFVNSFYSPAAGKIARTGSGPGWFYELSRLGGAVIALMSWKIMAVKLIYQGVSYFAQKGSSKFYTMSPTMVTYWGSVQTIVNQLAVNMGIVPRIGRNIASFSKDTMAHYPDDMLAKLQSHSPGVINNHGTIDVYALATRAQRQARKRMDYIEAGIESEKSLIQIYEGLEKMDNQVPNSRGYLNYLDSWLSQEISQSKTEVSEKVSGVDGGQASDINQDTNTIKAMREAGNKPGFRDFIKAEFDDGAAFVSFRVNYTGSVSESFSNSTGESEIASQLNNLVAKAKNLSFGLTSAIEGTGIDTLLEKARSVVEGVAEGMGIGGIVGGVLSTATGGSFIDIPQVWKGSTAQLPRTSYTIQLVTPNNHPYAQLFYQYVPLAMLLAMSLPISTGKQSYTSPFILEYFDQGRTQSRLAMVDSLSITRGVANLGFNKDNRAMGIEVNISFTSLDSVIHMPISQGLGIMDMALSVAQPVNIITSSGIFDDDNAYTDYLATLSSMGLTDQIYSFRKLKLNLTREMLRWSDRFSPARLASSLGNSWPGRMVNSLLYEGTVRN